MISRMTLLIFCLPAILQSFMHGPAGAVLQGVYAKEVGLSLTALASAILISRVFDAVSDPLIGYLSDRTQEKFGTRKPWLIGGMAISVIAVWQLYTPDENATAMSFTIWFVLAYLGWTMVEIPYRSWGLALSGEYAERTRVMTWVAMGTAIGGMAFFV
ncbi:MAG: MFS transporter, partial [Alphaproteobacteria bacterium]